MYWFVGGDSFYLRSLSQGVTLSAEIGNSVCSPKNMSIYICIYLYMFGGAKGSAENIILICPEILLIFKFFSSGTMIRAG